MLMMMIRNKFNINQHFVSIPRIVCQIASGFHGLEQKNRVRKNMLILGTGASVTQYVARAAHTHIGMTGAQRTPW